MQNQEANFEDMNTLSSCTNSVVRKGYTELFQAKEEGLFAPSNKRHYKANEVRIDNFYRFEGASNPSDSSILYILQTHDGVKGLLIDSYGMATDEQISQFIKDVETIKKTEAVGH